jgi:hypothetical protein
MAMQHSSRWHGQQWELDFGTSSESTPAEASMWPKHLSLVENFRDRKLGLLKKFKSPKHFRLLNLVHYMRCIKLSCNEPVPSKF